MRGWTPHFDWWTEVSRGERVTADFAGRSLTEIVPFDGALGVALPPGPKDWPAPRGWAFHAIAPISGFDHVGFRVRRASPHGGFSPLTRWLSGRAAMSGVLGILRKGSAFRTSDNIRTSI